MKKKWISSLMLLGSGLAFANDATFVNAVRFQVENFKTSCGKCEASRPYGIIATADAIGKANLSTDSIQNMRYGEAEIDLLYGFKVGPMEGFTLEAGYGSDYVNWNTNPYFNQKNFNYINLALLGYTGSVDNWFWQTGFGAHLNNDYNNGWFDYARFGGFLWGRYTLTPSVGLHVGTITLTGLQRTVTFPLVGFDWRIAPKWNLDFIFPVQMELSYYLTQKWILSTYIRPFLTRQRLSPNESFQGVFEYRNIGGELNLSYQYCGLDLSFFGGYTFSALFKVMDSQGNKGTYYNFEDAPYVGFDILWAF